MEKKIENKIEPANYTGYLWESDQEKPLVLKNTPYSRVLDDKSNPFIVEGMLFDGKRSISIKYINGKYLVSKTEVQPEDFNSPDVERRLYIANFDGAGWLKFLEYWQPESDCLCEDMNVLRMKKRVFVGFTNDEKERKVWQR